MKNKLPLFFKPILWFLRWDKINIETDKEDIIVNTINEGSLTHWRWIIKTYGKDVIRKILKKRLTSEFHPESINLARVLFNIPPLRHAR